MNHFFNSKGQEFVITSEVISLLFAFKMFFEL